MSCHTKAYNFIWGIIISVVILISTFAFVIPYWISTYVPILITAPFHPTFMMMGFYCLNINTNSTFFESMHFIFSLTSLGALILFVIEYYSLSDPSDRFHTTYCFPSVYGCTGAKTIVNASYSAPVETEGSYLTEATEMIVGFVFFFMLISILHIFISMVALFNRCGSKPSEEEEEETKPKKRMKNICDECNGKMSIHTLTISVLSAIIFFCCLAEWVIGLYMYSISIVVLNPSYYNSLLLVFICIPLLYVPRPSIPPNTEVKTEEIQDREEMELLGTDDEDVLISNVPIKSNEKKLLFVYLSIIGLSIIFYLVEISLQSVWISNNGGSLTDQNKMALMLDSPLYFNFTNVEYIQYLPNTDITDTLQNKAFALYTYIIAVIDTVNFILSLGLLIAVSYYTYKVIHLEGRVKS